MSSFISDIGDVFEEAIDFVEDVADAVGLDDVFDFIEDVVDEAAKGLVEATRWTAQAAKDVGDFLDDATSKDGWLTNFVQDYIPGGGLVTAGVHAAAGNFDYAEYAAVKGASTAAVAAAGVVGGALLGPAGAILLGMAAGAAASAFESGMKEYLAASVKDKIADLSVSDVLIGAAAGGAGAALGKAVKASRGLTKLKGKLGDALRKVRNGARGLRGKPPIVPRIGPKTLSESLKKDVLVNLALSPATGVPKKLLEDQLPRGGASPSTPEKQAGCLKPITSVLVAILVAILILIFTGIGGGSGPVATSSGVLNPSDKSAPVVPVSTGETEAVPETATPVTQPPATSTGTPASGPTTPTTVGPVSTPSTAVSTSSTAAPTTLAPATSAAPTAIVPLVQPIAWANGQNDYYCHAYAEMHQLTTKWIMRDLAAGNGDLLTTYEGALATMRLTARTNSPSAWTGLGQTFTATAIISNGGFEFVHTFSAVVLPTVYFDTAFDIDGNVFPMSISNESFSSNLCNIYD